MNTSAELTNESLVTHLTNLAQTSHDVDAQLIEHLASFIERRLHKELGFRSPYAYVTSVLGFSRDAAQRRIRAAKAVLRKPKALEHLREGLLTISSLAALLPAIDHPGLLTFALGRSKRDVEVRVDALRGGRRQPARQPTLSSLEGQLGPRVRHKLRRARKLLKEQDRAASSLDAIEAGLDALLATLEEAPEESSDGGNDGEPAPRSMQPRLLPLQIGDWVLSRDTGRRQRRTRGRDRGGGN